MKERPAIVQSSANALISVIALLFFTGCAASHFNSTSESQPNKEVLQSESSLLRVQVAYSSDLAKTLTGPPKKDIYPTLSSKYEPVIKRLIPSGTSPQDLEQLAMWCQSHDKWLNTPEKIFRTVAGECLYRLKTSKNSASLKALQNMKAQFQERDAFDGEWAELIEEALAQNDS